MVSEPYLKRLDIHVRLHNIRRLLLDVYTSVMHQGLALNERGELAQAHVLQFGSVSPDIFQLVEVGATKVLIRKSTIEGERLQFEELADKLAQEVGVTISEEELCRRLETWGTEAVQLIAVMCFLGLWKVVDNTPRHVVAEKVDPTSESS